MLRYENWVFLPLILVFHLNLVSMEKTNKQKEISKLRHSSKKLLEGDLDVSNAKATQVETLLTLIAQEKRRSLGDMKKKSFYESTGRRKTVQNLAELISELSAKQKLESRKPKQEIEFDNQEEELEFIAGLIDRLPELTKKQLLQGYYNDLFDEREDANDIVEDANDIVDDADDGEFNDAEGVQDDSLSVPITQANNSNSAQAKKPQSLKKKFYWGMTALSLALAAVTWDVDFLVNAAVLVPSSDD